MLQATPSPLTRCELFKIVNFIKALPSAEVEQNDNDIIIRATKKKTGERVIVLNARSMNGAYWHVEAEEGILSVKSVN